jgi:hypothetical protein
MKWDWRLTITKGVVVGTLAALGVALSDIQSVPAWWVGLAMLGLETVRDLIKSRFGSFVPATKAE